MRDPFFEEQAKQCNDLATTANNAKDREFWLQLGGRWEDLLRAQQRHGAEPQTVKTTKMNFRANEIRKKARGIAPACGLLATAANNLDFQSRIRLTIADLRSTMFGL
jgi:hypothetical protein